MGNRAERGIRNKDPQTSAVITSCNQQLRDLNKQLEDGLISNPAYNERRDPIVEKLHEAMWKSGRNPIRTKKKPPLTQ